MSDSRPSLRLFYMPLSNPCGPKSSCCGPVGQSAAEVTRYSDHLKAILPGLQVETISVIDMPKLRLGRDDEVIRLLNSYGANACPIFELNGKVVVAGPCPLEELTERMKAKPAKGRGSSGK